MEFPHIRSVYSLYKAASKIENAHFPTEGHDYGATKRQPVYAFLARHLGLDLTAVKRTKTGGVDESFIQYFRPVALRCFDSRHPVPAHALRGKEVIRKAFTALQGQAAKSRIPKKAKDGAKDHD